MEKKEELGVRIESKGYIYGSEYCEIIISKKGYMETHVPVFGHDFEDILYISELVRGAIKDMRLLDNTPKKRPDN